MIQMGQKLEVLRLHIIKGISKKEISREMGISRNTVKRYIKEFKEKNDALIESGVSEYELIENMVEKPKYDTSSRKRRVLTDEIKLIIKEYVKNNETKKQNGQRKMLMSAQDMHEELAEKGHQISYSTVAQYVQKHKESQTTYEAFIKQKYELGEVCEFDWGDVKLVIAGKEQRLKMAVFTMAKSSFRYAYLYPYENSQCFVDSHIRFFESISGVPKTMVYDNMKVAVARFVGRTEKEATEALKKMALYYGFDFRFCNVRKGNEKGHVENSVDFIRRKAFSLSNIFESEEEAQKRLSQRVEKHNKIHTKYLQDKSPNELMMEEKQFLGKLMPAYVNYTMVTAMVDKLATVSYKQNRYSVPDFLVKKVVDLKIYIDKIEAYFNNKKVSSHKRLNGNHLWSIDIMHYKKTLSRKPGALCGSVAFYQMQEELKKIYNMSFKEDNKGFIGLLDIVSEYGIEKVMEVIEKLKQGNIYINLDNIKMIIQRKSEFLSESMYSQTKMGQEIEDFSRKQLYEYGNLMGAKDISEVEIL